MAKALVLRLDRRPSWHLWWLEFYWLDRHGDPVLPLHRLPVPTFADIGAYRGTWGVFDVIVERTPFEQEPDRRWEVTAIYQWGDHNGRHNIADAACSRSVGR